MATEKLIDANEVKKKLRVVKEWFNGYPSGEHDKLAQAVVKMCIEEVNKIKPVEVVRCKDCENWQKPWLVDQTLGVCQVGKKTLTEPNHFCSYGEKRAEDGK